MNTSKRAKKRRPVRLAPKKDAKVEIITLIQRAMSAFFIFTVPLLIYLKNTEYGYTKTIYLYLAITVLYALWGAKAWLQKEQHVCLPPLFWPGLLLLGAGALSLFNASSVGIGVQSLAVLSSYLLFYVFVVNALSDRTTFELYVGAAVLTTLFSGLYGLLQYYGALPGLPGRVSGRYMMISAMGNKNFLAEYLNSWLFPTLILLSGSVRHWGKALVLATSAVGFAVLLVADSTGALLGVGASLVLVLAGMVLFRAPYHALRPHRAWIAGWLAVLALVYVALAAPGFLKAPEVEQGISQLSQAQLVRAASSAFETTQVRAAALVFNPVQPLVSALNSLLKKYLDETRTWDWSVAYEMFKEHPLLGVGLGNYKVLFLDYKAKFFETERGKQYNFYIPRAAQAHSDYVQAAAELGAVGVLAIVWMLLVLAWQAWRQLKRQTVPLKRLAALVLYAGALAFLVDAAVNFPAHLAASAFNVVLLLGLAHSPYLLPRAKKVLFKGVWLRAGVIAFLVVSVGVSAFAYRDWQANIYLNQGNKYSQRGLYRLALDQYKRSLALDFQPAEVLFKLGATYQALGDDARAERFFERSLHSFVVDEVFLPLAMLKAKHKNYVAAKEITQRFIATQPSAYLFQEAELLLAVIEMRSGNLETSLAQLQQLKKKYPGFAKVYLSLAEVATQQGRYAQALAYYQQALDIVEADLASARAQMERWRGQTIPAQRVSSVRARIENNTRLREEILKTMKQFKS